LNRNTYNFIGIDVYLIYSDVLIAAVPY